MKTKFILAISCLLSLSAVIHSQPSVQKYISYGQYFSGGEMQQDANGDLISTTLAVDSMGALYPGLMKLDTSGNVIWANQQVYSNSGFAFRMKITSDNGVIYTGNYFDASGFAHGIFSRFDSAGNLLWSRIFSQSFNSAELQDAVELPSGNFLVTGSTSSKLCILKVSSDGFTIWSKTYDHSPYSLSPHCLVPDNAGDFYVGGRLDSNFIFRHGFVTKIDSDGTVQWAKEYDFLGNAEITGLISNDDGSFTALLTNIEYQFQDSFKIFHQTEAGDIDWFHVFYQQNERNRSGFEIFQLGGEPLITGTTYDSTAINPTEDLSLLSLYSFNGGLNLSVKFSTDRNEEAGSVVTQGDEVIILSSVYSSDFDSGSIYFLKINPWAINECNESNHPLTSALTATVITLGLNLFIQTGSNLEVENPSNNFINPSSQTICFPVSIETLPLPEADITVIPNPALSKVTIQLSNTRSGIESLKLYDVTGKMMKEIYVISSSQATIERNDLPSGIYLLKVKTGDKEFQTKIIFE